MLLILPFGDEPSDQLEFLFNVFRAGGPLYAVAMLLFLSVVPGLVEESLFRGYVQRRLLRRWHPAVAIAFTSLFFAAAHIDPQHALAVLPLGVWFGIVAWRAGTIWPTILCHFFINVIGIVNARFAEDPSETMVKLDLTSVALMVVVGVCFVVSVIVLVRYGRSRESSAGQ